MGHPYQQRGRDDQLVGATAAPLLSRWSVRLSTVVSLGLLAGSAVLLAMMAPAVFAGRVLVHYLGRIGPVDGHVLASPSPPTRGG
jgi:hypothetical protein